MNEATRPYRALVLCFCAFTVVQSGSAAWLFATKLGLEPARVEAFYRGTSGGLPRSLPGLLEVLVPHLVAIPLTLFILIHLNAWVRRTHGQQVARWSRLTFAAAFAGLGAGLCTRFVWAGFAVLKLGAFLAFEVLVAGWVVALTAAFWRSSAAQEPALGGDPATPRPSSGLG